MRSDVTAAIFRALEEGLDTSPAIGARVGISAEAASTRLYELAHAGRVLRAGTIPRRGKPLVRWMAAPGAGKPPPLADLPPLPDASGMSLTALLLGDALPGRSEADRRGLR